MRRWLTALVIAICGIGLFVGGLINARNMAQRCGVITNAYLASNPQIGYGLDSKPVRVSAKDVAVEVAGPFQVVTYYSVPRDLHASVYYRHYWAFPWGCRLRKTSVSHPI